MLVGPTSKSTHKNWLTKYERYKIRLLKIRKESFELQTQLGNIRTERALVMLKTTTRHEKRFSIQILFILRHYNKENRLEQTIFKSSTVSSDDII